MSSFYLLDQFATVKPGEPYRLFPYGKIVKGGKEIYFTPDLARKFKLPHFKPPIKRGSHKEETPAGGYIVGLEVREDGLYAIPEWNEPGEKAINDGDYRYHSPEVVWDDGAVFEDPKTGAAINGPLIVGDALLHMPHLGEDAALYTVSKMEEKEKMTDEIVNIPKPFWEELMAKMPWNASHGEEENLADPKVAEEFEAIKQERDRFEAELERLAEESKIKEAVSKYAAEIKDLKVNQDGLAELLANLMPDDADKIVQVFKALSEQIKESELLDEKGTSGDGDTEDPVEMLNAAVNAKVNELNLTYGAALAAVRIEQPELVSAVYGRGK